MAPRVINCIARLAPNREAHLRDRTAHIDHSGISFELLGQIAEEDRWEDIRVDGTRDSGTDSAADRREQRDERQHHWDAVAIGGGHDRHVLADDKGAAGDGDEDLAHDGVADGPIVAAEVDHQARAEHHQRQAEEQARILEVLGVADVDAEDDAPEAGADVVDLRHVAGLCDVEVVHDLHPVVVEEVPAVEAVEEDRGKNAGAEDGALLE